MQTLREKLLEGTRFLIAAELVSVRGSMAEGSAIRTRNLAADFVADPNIDWISITDNAGGHPRLAPLALGRPLLYAGKEVVLHLTCKDLNRNGLESEAWMLNSEGFHNILAMTGDYPVAGSGGLAKPVFDIDSVALISLLNNMNRGLSSREARGDRRLEQTQFCIGAVVSNFKLREGEVMPQYRKLEKKIQCGANFIINQIGFDARKASELRLYMDARGMSQTPLIGNVCLLNARVAEIFRSGRIAGVVLAQPLAELCRRQSQSPDQGRAFFAEFAARQMAIYRGLGYRGVYLGGIHRHSALEKVLEIERSFAPDDWKQFARDIQFSRPGEFFFYAQDPTTALADPTRETSRPPVPGKHLTVVYRISKLAHDTMFAPGTAFAQWGANACAHAHDPYQGPAPLRALEHLSKSVLYHCRDCGDCSLPEIAYLCPESQCAKNQRNGPCGGTREGRCEVDGFGDCIWLRAWERLRHDGREQSLLDHAPVVQNQGLRRTSAWANNWLGRDHAAQPALETAGRATDSQEGSPEP
ncbi:MAG TPA: methylenetetrahydrofolate reductase C-terminal domain-containing protein [Acidobacteriaceae bacterium]|nr:methylenetetrahydrofolate reductase C-terminal domain-containing protein [Acidobacteriaceae bacterium]